ncbi:MAG: hypothetical protein JO010_07495 [Alphaproteobacteria bacterium]|nr:hypothetical protein [Alphaproteobacteria bacterium]
MAIARFPGRRAGRVLPCLLAALILAGCQPLPHPLAEDAPPPGSEILTPRDGAGIIVQPVAGVPAPLGSDIAAALAAALQESDVPASAQIANKASFSLLGTAQERPAGERVVVELRWELRDHGGAVLGTHGQTIEAALADWRAGQPALLAKLAKGAAPPIADLLQDEGATPAAADEPRILVRRVAGAPGDGPRTLAGAMRAVLRKASLAVEDSEKNDGRAAAGKLFTVEGTVSMAAAVAGKQKVKVTWALRDPAGAQIGQVSQENAVAEGSLDGAWGDIAYAVAEAAGSGIIALIDHLKTGRSGS